MTPEEKEELQIKKYKQEFEDTMNRIMENSLTKTVKLEFNVSNEKAIEIIKFVEELSKRN